MKSLLYCRDPGKAGQNFIPAKRDHAITPLLSFEIFKIVCVTKTNLSQCLLFTVNISSNVLDFAKSALYSVGLLQALPQGLRGSLQGTY